MPSTRRAFTTSFRRSGAPTSFRREPWRAGFAWKSGHAKSPSEASMSSRVYVGNLDFSVSDQFLREVFGRCDGFLSAQTMVSSSTGHPLGFGYVDFQSRRQALAAVESFDGLAVLGRSL